MAVEYSVEVCRKLQEKFSSTDLYRPERIGRYEPGTELVYEVTAVEQADKGRVHLIVDKFVGGGFAGQVYRVKITQIEAEGGRIGALEVGGIYAIKILIPPSGFSMLFRNFLYWVGFQGPFQLQVNPTAARSGALWQKFIRRGAQIRFGNESSVVDIHATFVDSKLGSCGELSEWVDGRTWKLEVDDHLDFLKQWQAGKNIDAEKLGSPEYRAKKQFMADFVKLLHDMGGHEFARQYEWSTCKSQPNCLKRKNTDDDPTGGLVAVDFRAGLVLLPFLPMSPGDFKLIASGIKRGSLVQFDKGNISRLKQFVDSHSNEFVGMESMLEELEAAESVYRNSVPDITHNHIRLLYSGKLWSTILKSAVTGWKVRGLIDNSCEKKLQGNKILTLVFFFIGVIPLLGRFLRKMWGREDWRKHYIALFTKRRYLGRAIRGRIAEKVIGWHRTGRVGAEQAIKLTEQPWRYCCQLPFLILIFPGLHRFFADSKFRNEKLVYIFIRPVRLYFDTGLREQWLRDMVRDGRKKHILSDDDAEIILSQVNEPFIQKYLKSLAVHVCTLPVTQIVSVAIAGIYYFTHRDEPNAWAIGLGIIGIFQVIPISPGSICRGLYVLYLVIKERNFKDYNIAVFLGFFKYIGYLAFPIQMTYHYPALARFMAGHWSTEAVHIVAVFGERGALLEHWVFCLFYNWPLTLRRRMQKRAELRASAESRYWHIAIYSVIAAGIFVIADIFYFRNNSSLPGLRDTWWLVALAVIVPLLSGATVTLGCKGAVLWKRIVAAAICGVAVGMLYSVGSAILGYNLGIFEIDRIATNCVWRIFIFSILSTIGAIFAELKLPDPDLK